MKQDKMPQEKDKPKLKLEDDVSFMTEQPIASATECTGLTPFLPVTEDEAENYADLYTVPVPRQINNAVIRRKPLHRNKSNDKKT